MLKKRPILDKIIKQLDGDLVLILIGARQVGKTFLLKALMDYLPLHYPNHSVLYFDLEQPDILAHFDGYRAIVDYLTLQGVSPARPSFILLDEFQKMPAPTKNLKILHDHYPYLKIIATGSSSLDIFSKLRQESMAGRKRVFDVFPLDFTEFLDFSSQNNAHDMLTRLLGQNVNPSAGTSELIPAWEQHALWGGYPRVALASAEEEKKAALAEMHKAYIERDVAGFLNTEDSIGFNKFVSLLAAQSGSLFNLNEMMKMLGLTRLIAEKYIYLLEHTFIIKLVRPFFSNRHKEIIKMPKLYFIDNGLRNWLIQNFSALEFRPDKGHLVENAVFSELYKHTPLGSEINFWRTPQGAEVDFVIKQGERLTPVEVKCQTFTKASVPSGLKAFISRYRPQNAYVLSNYFSGETTWQKCHVQFLPAFMTAKIAMELGHNPITASK